MERYMANYRDCLYIPPLSHFTTQLLSSIITQYTAMAMNPPSQNSFLYMANWTPALDSLLCDTMIRLKIENDWDGTTYPSHFILEAESVIEHELEYSFDWAALTDRLHFLERRFKTFKEVLEVDGTKWDERTNILIAGQRVWTDILPRNPLAGAYLSHDDPAYHKLALLFPHTDVKVEREKTVIVISDSPESCNNEFLFQKENCYGHGFDHGAAADSEPGDHVRRKLLFQEGSPSDMESTNNKGSVYYAPGKAGKKSNKMDTKLGKASGSRQVQPRVPPKVPTYSCDSSSPIMWWKMPLPRKPPM